jgi:hypothetical protein
VGVGGPTRCFAVVDPDMAEIVSEARVERDRDVILRHVQRVFGK